MTYHAALLQRRATGPGEVQAIPPIVDTVLRTPGEPFDAATRKAMETGFANAGDLAPEPGVAPVLTRRNSGPCGGDEYEQQAETVAKRATSNCDWHGLVAAAPVDFSQVRVHSDPLAAAAANAVNAFAFTAGSHLVFGPGQYAPQAASGRELIAHELTHVLQQGKGQAPAIQLACRAPAHFDFTASTIAARIRAALAQITVPSQIPGGAGGPRVDPARVLTILASSNCFLQDAQTIERTYFAHRGPTGGRAPLTFHFHEDPGIGSHFARDQGGHRVEVEIEGGVTTATPQALVGRIVHEVAHATHGPATPRPRRGTGAVTRAEEAGVTEEAQTRRRENEVMEEIAAAQSWSVTPTPARREDVRASFRSGLPMLTYQEYFIVEEMKRRNRVSRLDETQAVAAARQMAATGGLEYVSPASTGTFTFDAAAVARHGGIAAAVPVEPPSIDDALECARLGQSSRPPADMSAACTELLRILRGSDPLPYEPVERRARMHAILMNWQLQRYQYQVMTYRASSAFIRWYNGLPEAVRSDAKTLGFFQWALIAESMSREWLNLGRMDADARRRHFEFLRAMIGDGLLTGMSEPPNPRAAVRR
jgi:hypothetical protein